MQVDLKEKVLMISRKMTTELLTKGQTYTRKQLMAVFRKAVPTLTESSFQWTLGRVLKSGDLFRIGYDGYALPSREVHSFYAPLYSEHAERVMKLVDDVYPYVSFTVFETVLMNEFLNHLIAQNTIFISVEKDSSPFVFRTLQEAGCGNIMLKPSRNTFNLYWTQDSIVVIDMVSEAPLAKDAPHRITIEKMLVDLYCDKLIAGMYSLAEFPSVLEQACKKYQVDRVRLLRYARRRNKESEVREILFSIK